MQNKVLHLSYTVEPPLAASFLQQPPLRKDNDH